MIDKIERLVIEVQEVLKEFNMGDSAEDYTRAVEIIRYRRGLINDVQRVINNQLKLLN